MQYDALQYSYIEQESGRVASWHDSPSDLLRIRSVTCSNPIRNSVDPTLTLNRRRVLSQDERSSALKSANKKLYL
uniref:AlNc14C12G1498 protein n=1 Tax=Albugo laibachii Nc14 TaxID=890382 RepID=F0W3C1_9STRA|nr:AlNc14C12G1498 [Albugo laibachii Nc14]|eukprot:CCA15564.1 AlNc14C12G1498 [Albugo laibachii Nc14]